MSNLDDVYDLLDQPHKYGHYIASLCPFHTDSRPSFMVYEDYYRCLSCNAHGKTEYLLQKLGHSTRLIAVEPEFFENPFTRWLKWKDLPDIMKLAWENINKYPALGEYIYNRGIDEQHRRHLKIGYLDDWITIPIRDVSGTIVGATARSTVSDKRHKYVCPHGQSPLLLYAPTWKLYDRFDTLLVTFGIIDAITLAINGVMAVSSLTGKSVNPMAFDGIGKNIVFVPDEGEELDAHKIAAKLGWRGKVWKIDWPDGCKDINDIWMKDKNLMKELLKNELSRRLY